MAEATESAVIVSAADITALSDKELFKIFDLLSMSDLMKIPQVCRRWKFIHEIVCRSKKTLTLYNWQYRYHLEENVHSLCYWSHTTFATKFKDHAFFISSFFVNKKVCNQLMKYFSNVKTLNLIGPKIHTHLLVSFFKRWPKLERLTLAFYRDWTCQPEWDWNLFWRELESLQCLKHFALPFDCDFIEPLYQNVMPRLNSLNITLTPDNGDSIASLFNNIQPNLQSLTLNNLFKTDFDDENDGNYFDLNVKFISLLEEKPHIFTQLTHLGWHFKSESGVDAPLLEFICNHFTSLTSLDLNIDKRLSLIEMVPLLARLQHLSCLRIKLNHELNFADEDSVYEESIADDYEMDISLARDRFNYEYYYGSFRSYDFFSNITPENVSQSLSIKLENIQCLHLVEFDFFRWEHFYYLRTAFPNVETIHFDDCEFILKRVNAKRSNSKRNQSRRKRLLRAFQLFSKLKLVYRNNELLLDLTKVASSEEKKKAAIESKLKELFKQRETWEPESPEIFEFDWYDYVDEFGSYDYDDVDYVEEEFYFSDYDYDYDGYDGNDEDVIAEI